MDDDLGERDLAVGAQGDLEFGILSRIIADQASGGFDAKKPRENGHCRTPEWLRTGTIDGNRRSLAPKQRTPSSIVQSLFFEGSALGQTSPRSSHQRQPAEAKRSAMRRRVSPGEPVVPKAAICSLDRCFEGHG
jgi:hypothetical protein